MKKYLLLLIAFASSVTFAQGFDYAGYGIDDPAAFNAAMQQSCATMMACWDQMEQTAAACETSMREMAQRMPPPTPQQQLAALNAFQDAQLMSLRMENSRLDAEMSADACRAHSMDILREKGEMECAYASGVTLDQYRKANEMGVSQLNGCWSCPQANDTYYGNANGSMYRIDMNGNAYEITPTGEYLMP